MRAATHEARNHCGKDPENVNHPLFALRRSAHLGLAAMLILVMAACAPADDGDAATDGGDNTGGGTVAVSGGTVEITADDLAFDANVIQATAGEAFTITLVNNDSMPHNISIYVEEGGDEIVIGDVINEGETIEVEVPALDAGEYFFVCDVHPQEMTGSVVVEG
jgi:plastocyanin